MTTKNPSSDSDKPCCPKCGGTSGYARLERHEVINSYDWANEQTSDGPFYNSSNPFGHYWSSKMIGCINCGKRMRRLPE